MDNNNKSMLEREVIELKQKLKESTTQMEQLSSRLLKAEGQRSGFLSHVLNEINNPLTSILGLTNNIQKMASEDPALVQKQATLAYKEAFDLDYKMRNIFSAAEIEGGLVAVRPSIVDVEGMLKNTLCDLQFKCSGKELEINTYIKNSPGTQFITDPSMLQAMMLNLLGNAIEYSNIAQPVEVDLQLSSSKMFFAVTDKGPGLTTEQQKTIFERFKQLDEGVTKAHPGTGLGLSIIREYTDLLEGELSVKSILGNGSTFILVLPNMQGKTIMEESEEMLFGEEEIF